MADPAVETMVGAPGRIDPELLARAKAPDIRVGRGQLAAEIMSVPGRYALITQPEPLHAADPLIAANALTARIIDSLQADRLEALVAGLPEVDHVVGLGGGMAMDAAKYVAWRRATRLLLAPSIVSVDAVVTNTVAVRRGGSVVYEGFVVADRIVADLELISQAPQRLNRAGVGDLLSIHTGRYDWALGARHGRIAFDKDIDRRARRVLERIISMASDIATVSDSGLEAILRAYAEVNAVLLEVGHAGPEEGSEHYFAYHAEAVTGRSFVHGELVSLGTLLMSMLQDNEPRRVLAFLEASGVEWRPEGLGLGRDVLASILGGLPSFVRKAGLPYSVIDEADLGPVAVVHLLDALADGILELRAGSASHPT